MSVSNDTWELVSAVFCRNTPTVEPPRGWGVADSCSQFESEAASRIQAMTHAYHGLVFRDLYVPCTGAQEVTQVDCVLLLPDRLVVVECKDCIGTVDCESVLADNEKPYWKQTRPDGSVVWLYSPIAQNMLHVRALSAYTGVSYPKCFSLIIFADRTQLLHVPELNNSQAVIQLSQLDNLNFRPVPARVFSSYRYNALVKCLEACQVPRPEVVEKHHESVNKKVNRGPRPVAPSVCPKCGSLLQKRYGRTEFLGCSMYPLCDYTFGLGV